MAAQFIKALAMMAGSVGIGYILLVAVSPTEKDVTARINANRVHPLQKIPVSGKPRQLTEEEKKSAEFMRVLKNAANAKQTVYGAKSAAAQGIHTKE